MVLSVNTNTAGIAPVVTAADCCNACLNEPRVRPLQPMLACALNELDVANLEVLAIFGNRCFSSHHWVAVLIAGCVVQCNVWNFCTSSAGCGVCSPQANSYKTDATPAEAALRFGPNGPGCLAPYPYTSAPGVPSFPQCAPLWLDSHSCLT